ncbi:intermembrane transport protein PqiB [Hydrocarboniphaga effusa]|uniref:PqiB family protein n=1 Tax=Hydrocarboniphaga effusa TaxID=243629 RepID=UPI0031382A2A
MSDNEENPSSGPQGELPTPRYERPRRWTISVIWVVPLIAALAAAVLGVRSYLGSGPNITITFKTAEGMEAGKTEVRYKEVPIGKVERVELSDDKQSVRVRIALIHDAEHVAVEDSRFWVVRPRIGLGGVSGLGTLISGAYIGVDVGESKIERLQFEGLEKAPTVTNDQQGRRFVLHAADGGSLDLGSPIYFRRIPVGRVVGRELDAEGKRVNFELFVDAPYDKLVTRNTRFWNASGVDVEVGAAGFKVDTQSVASIVAGGMAFQAFPEDEPGEIAPENTDFELFDDRLAAAAPSAEESMRLRLRFFQSTRGLGAGGPVVFQGIEIGRVKSVELAYDRDRRDFWSDVEIDVYPRNMGRAYKGWQQNTEREPKNADTFFRMLIERGLRAQMRTGNLLTGQLYISLDFDPKAHKYAPPAGQQPLEIPTSRGEFDQIQEQISNIVTKIEAMPLDEIGRNLNSTIKSTDELLKRFDGQVVPELTKAVQEVQRTLQSVSEQLSDDGRLQRDARGTLGEVERAARSLRSLGDYLQRHPESLLRGRPEAKGEPQTTQLPDPTTAAPQPAAPETP